LADTRGIKAGRAYVELGVSDKLTAALKRAQARLRAFGNSVTALGTRVLALGIGMATPFVLAAKTFAATGDAVAKMSRRTGMGVEALSELAYAAELSGTSMEGLENGLRRMQRSIYDAGRGLSTAVDGLADLGLTFEALDGLKPEVQFSMMAEAISRIEDPSRKAAIAMTLLGRSGTMILPMMANGAAGLNELRQKARDLGLTMTGADALGAERLTDAFTAFWKVIKKVGFAIGAALAPELSDLTERAAKWGAKAIAWIDNNRGLIVSMAKLTSGVIAAGAALIVGGKAIVIFSSLIGLAGTAITAMLSPIGLVIIAVGSLGALILKDTGAAGKAIDALRDGFAVLKDDATKAFTGVRDALSAGDIGLAAKILWKTLEIEWRRGVNLLTRIWAAFRNGFGDIMKSLGPILLDVGGRLVDTFSAIGLAAGKAMLSAISNAAKVFAIERHYGGAEEQAAKELATTSADLRRRYKGDRTDPEYTKKLKAAYDKHAALLTRYAEEEAKAVAGVVGKKQSKADILGELTGIWGPAFAGIDTTAFTNTLKGLGLSPEQLAEYEAGLAELEKLKGKRDKLVKAAAVGALGPLGPRSTGGTGWDMGEWNELWRLPDKIKDAASGLGAGIVRSMTGFSAAGLQSLQTQTQDDALKAAKETAKNTKKIADQGRPKFD